MPKYGSPTEEEARQEFWRFVREVAIGVGVILFIFISGVVFVCTLSGCRTY